MGGSKSMNANDARESRQLPLIERLSGKEPDVLRSEISNWRVLLLCTMPAEAFRSVRRALELSAQLIARFCPRIDLYAPCADDGWGRILVKELMAVDSRPDSSFRVVGSADPARYSAVLSIGPSALSVAHQVSVGWIGGHSHAVNGGPTPEVPIEGMDLFGIAGAAVEGSAAVFWKLVRPGLPHSIGAPFCWRRLVPASRCPGDALFDGRCVLPSTLLAGAGAVGAALAVLLSSLEEVRGSLLAADFDRVADTDLGRLLLASEGDLGMPKIELVKRALARHRGLEVNLLPGRVREAYDWLKAKGRAVPHVGISALDRWDSRVELSELLLDHVVEGSTDELTFRSFVSNYGSLQACLLCSHEPPKEASKADEVRSIARRTGLPESLVADSMFDPNLVVKVEHLEHLSGDLVDELRSAIGEKVCSVIAKFPVRPGEALGRSHQLVVSFVSMAAALATLARLISVGNPQEGPLDTIYQADFQQPLAAADSFSQRAVSTCPCVTRRQVNDRYRALRSAQAAKRSPTS